MKRGKHPTTKRRNQKQTVKERYAKAREDAQLMGVIPVEPVGAVRDERVDPSSQAGTPPLPSLVVQAARQGWATPEEKKPLIVDEMVKIATGQAAEMGPDGICTGPSPKNQVAAARALVIMDQTEWERRNPDAAGKAKGATNVNVGVSQTVSVFGSIRDLLDKAREQREVGRVTDESKEEVEAREATSATNGGEEVAQEQAEGETVDRNQE